MLDKPRYSRVSDIIDLATYMASKVQGITISDIMQRYNVSRRTAERMRDSLLNIFPEIDEIETNDTLKHWGFTNNIISSLINFQPKEIANLEQMITKIKALANKRQTNAEENIELFMQTEGYAIRQMPQYNINIETLDIIRKALQTSKIVKGIYHGKKREIEPLGMIYGEKIYLIAREKSKGDGIYNYLLHKFTDLTLTEKNFNKKDFNLQEYAKQSFGVYHGEILNVKLLFSKELAPEASNFNFHPTQKGKYNDDGTYTVTFKASGDKEIIWHVFRWGQGCKIISPKSLQLEYKKYLQDCLKN